MCGIIGISSNKSVSASIINSLKKLEYRGYDSAGIATLSKNIINEINNLLIEAGPVLAGAMLMNSLIDELVIYQAPHIMGSEVQSMFYTPAWTSLMNKQELIISEVRKVGQDIKIVAKPKKRV